MNSSSSSNQGQLTSNQENQQQTIQEQSTASVTSTEQATRQSQDPSSSTTDMYSSTPQHYATNTGTIDPRYRESATAPSKLMFEPSIKSHRFSFAIP